MPGSTEGDSVLSTGRVIAVEWLSIMSCFTLLLYGKIIMFPPLALLLQHTFDCQWSPDGSPKIVIDLDKVFQSAPLFPSSDTTYARAVQSARP